MVAVGVMKVAIDEVVDVIVVRHRFVSAAWAVDVTRFVASAAWRTLVRVLCADLDFVFVYMIAVRMVQMAIMEIVDVVAMFNCGVATVRTVLMVVVGVVRFVAGAHADAPRLARHGRQADRKRPARGGNTPSSTRARKRQLSHWQYVRPFHMLDHGKGAVRTGQPTAMGLDRNLYPLRSSDGAGVR